MKTQIILGSWCFSLLEKNVKLVNVFLSAPGFNSQTHSQTK